MTITDKPRQNCYYIQRLAICPLMAYLTQGNGRVYFGMEITSAVSARSPFDRTGQKSSNRSKLSNGKILPLNDGRSATARRFRDLVIDIAADLGGKEHLSEGQKQLIR